MYIVSRLHHSEFSIAVCKSLSRESCSCPDFLLEVARCWVVTAMCCVACIRVFSSAQMEDVCHMTNCLVASGCLIRSCP